MNNTNVFVTHLIKSQHFPYLFYFFLINGMKQSMFLASPFPPSPEIT